MSPADLHELALKIGREAAADQGLPGKVEQPDVLRRVALVLTVEDKRGGRHAA